MCLCTDKFFQNFSHKDFSAFFQKRKNFGTQFIFSIEIKKCCEKNLHRKTENRFIFQMKIHIFENRARAEVQKSKVSREKNVVQN